MWIMSKYQFIISSFGNTFHFPLEEEKLFLFGRFVANRWLNKLKHDQKLSMELFGSEQPGLKERILRNNSSLQSLSSRDL